MSFLASISLTSGRTLAAVVVLTALSLVAGAYLLPRYAPSRFPRPKRHWFARTVVVLVPILLVASAGALIANRSLGIVKTSGDLGKLIQSSVVGSEAQSGGEVTIGNQSIDPSALDASFTRTDDGMLVATWTGPTSGITLPVYVIAPRDYSPTDGKTYAVIELLHGYPGEADGTTQGAQVQQALDDAVDAGIIPPTIVVAPSLSVDEEAHDCADIEGRPPVYTWAAHEVPAMIRHNFPNTSGNRDAWMIGGFSAGAYCAARTAYDVPQRFGAVGVMSSYDLPGEGSLAHSGKTLQAQNGLSTMLGKRKPDGMRFYVLGAQDDSSGAARAAWLMDDAVRKPDSLTVDTPASGGHSWTLWNNYFPSLLTWWGSDPAVFKAAGVTAPQGDTWAKATAAGVKPLSETPKDQRVVGSVSPVRAMPFEINGLGTIIVAVVASLGALGAVMFWSPRWGRRRDGGKRSVARLGGAILGRVVVILVAAGLVAVTAGIGANASGGFYTSWRDLRASVRVNERAGK